MGLIAMTRASGLQVTNERTAVGIEIGAEFDDFIHPDAVSHSPGWDIHNPQVRVLGLLDCPSSSFDLSSSV